MGSATFSGNINSIAESGETGGKGGGRGGISPKNHILLNVSLLRCRVRATRGKFHAVRLVMVKTLAAIWLALLSRSAAKKSSGDGSFI